MPLSPARHARILATALLATAASLAALPAAAQTVSGPIEKITDGGGSVTVAGTVISISSSRTNICIAGVCDQGREKLKVGMTCMAELATRDGRPEARRLSCK